ncbi:hypothetical protein GMDG_08691 [Pseudogymnoascus destructans 20631-21]|uniref:Uncharacterized protein n=1 Tax=Pseudogymnoascus destructans (strain ATCC MYA-4855 / 20631-21) TaxID=658429 RepID=L8G970_PSED2|nr:hypothetical protein GMDG_08691 [Pseudogymnoascus destructans 20631-21]
MILDERLNIQGEDRTSTSIESLVELLKAQYTQGNIDRQDRQQESENGGLNTSSIELQFQQVDYQIRELQEGQEEIKKGQLTMISLLEQALHGPIRRSIPVESSQHNGINEVEGWIESSN